MQPSATHEIYIVLNVEMNSIQNDHGKQKEWARVRISFLNMESDGAALTWVLFNQFVKENTESDVAALNVKPK